MQTKQQGIFITGTDTGVGKTTIACALIPLLEAAGLSVVASKPVETGCRISGLDLIAEDATRLAKALTSQPSFQTVCRYRYAAMTSPARAAELAGDRLYLEDLVACCIYPEHYVVVEGAGGLLSPIASDGLNIDLIAALSFPVVVVSEDRLGCINQVLMALEVLAQRKLQVAAVVLNTIESTINRSDLDNNSELGAWTDIPIIMAQSNSPYHQTLASFAERLAKKAQD